MEYTFDAILQEIPENGGAYVFFPWDIRKEFGKGRVKVHATFDGIPYDGKRREHGRERREWGDLLCNRCIEGDSEEAGEEERGYDPCCHLGEMSAVLTKTDYVSKRDQSPGLDTKRVPEELSLWHRGRNDGLRRLISG